jgi:hypothetical protein
LWTKKILIIEKKAEENKNYFTIVKVYPQKTVNKIVLQNAGRKNFSVAIITADMECVRLEPGSGSPSFLRMSLINP